MIEQPTDIQWWIWYLMCLLKSRNSNLCTSVFLRENCELWEGCEASMGVTWIWQDLGNKAWQFTRTGYNCSRRHLFFWHLFAVWYSLQSAATIWPVVKNASVWRQLVCFWDSGEPGRQELLFNVCDTTKNRLWFVSWPALTQICARVRARGHVCIHTQQGLRKLSSPRYTDDEKLLSKLMWLKRLYLFFCKTTVPHLAPSGRAEGAEWLEGDWACGKNLRGTQGAADCTTVAWPFLECCHPPATETRSG